MNTKLTLKLDSEVIEKAKKFAKENNSSLSLLVENYFRILAVDPGNSEIQLSKGVLELSGVVKLNGDFDVKSEYHKHLDEKYGS